MSTVHIFSNYAEGGEENNCNNPSKLSHLLYILNNYRYYNIVLLV